MIRNSGRRIFCLLLTSGWLGVSLLAGCGDGRPGRVPVSGQVLIDGQPLVYGFVRFIPKTGRPSSGQLDEQGRFGMSTYGKKDGVIPGEYQVAINAAEEISSKKKKWHAPKKYFDARTSGLTEVITEPTDSLVINLTWDGGKPFVESSR